MKRQFSKSPASACQLCEYVSFRQQSSVRRPIQRYLSSTKPSTAAWQQQPRVLVKPPKPVSIKTSGSPRNDQNSPPSSRYAIDYSQSQLKINLQEIAAKRDAILSGKVPTEGEVMEALTYCDVLAESLIQPSAIGAGTSASNALLSLDERNHNNSTKKDQALPPFIDLAFKQISQIAYSIVSSPSVYITPAILSLYVQIQAKLGKPNSLPEAFHLYANKPIPLLNTDPIQYKKSNPNKAANAIASKTADLALQTAIDARQLNAAIDIIDNTYATTAYHRSKILQQALLPIGALVTAPIAIYALATQLAGLQSTMDTEMATKVAFAGMIAYVGFTGTIGFIAVTTANDQMDRVTWVPGIPLRERWLREQERAAFDKVAGAWGFRESWRRGEEEGEEWEALRECIGRKGMILDCTALMEGME